jgi:hypothetical protein
MWKLASVLAWACVATAQQQPDLVLSGTISRADYQRYKEVAFTVPEGATRLTVEFTYTGREQQTVIDLGVFDGERFRGWSGGNKSSFTLSAADATPSFLAGPIRAGRWFLLLGVPNIREGVTSPFTAKIYFGRSTDAPLRSSLGWYRGDLHTHSGHSDGACSSQSGVRVPCPVFKTAQAAVDRGLDFVAITDHNTISQFNDLRELQLYFDRLLLIPGREITTFQGHANVFGPVDFIDFRLGGESVPNFAALLDRVSALHGLISINHPMAPSGETCMGCGWTVSNTDFGRIHAIEAANGGVTDGPFSGIPFWEGLLNRGFRLTAVGGSDNHDAGKSLAEPGSVGYPETVVHARELAQDAILEGIRAGHVFLDLEGSRDRLLEYTASTLEGKAEMGDTIAAKRGEVVRVTVHVVNVSGGWVELIEDGHSQAKNELTGNIRTFDWTSNGARHWLRVVVRTPDGNPVLLGNPVYVNY